MNRQNADMELENIVKNEKVSEEKRFLLNSNTKDGSSAKTIIPNVEVRNARPRDFLISQEGDSSLKSATDESILSDEVTF